MKIEWAPDVDLYHFRSFWSEEDGEYVAVVSEFPSLSVLGPDREIALKELHDLLLDVVAEMAESGETIPAPLRVDVAPDGGTMIFASRGGVIRGWPPVQN